MKKVNIWDNYDFNSIKKSVDKKDKSIEVIHKDYADIIKEEFYLSYKNDIKISIESTPERLHINLVLSNESRIALETIFMTRDGKFCLFDFRGDKPYKFTDKEMFRNMIKQIIVDNANPFIIKLYKQNSIEKLPEILESSKSKIDLSKLTTARFKEIFEEVSENEMNGETVEDLEIQTLKNKVTINFSVNCGRYGFYKMRFLTVNDKGNVDVDLDDTPLEGSGVESGLQEEILKLITNE